MKLNLKQLPQLFSNLAGKGGKVVNTIDDMYDTCKALPNVETAIDTVGTMSDFAKRPAFQILDNVNDIPTGNVLNANILNDITDNTPYAALGRNTLHFPEPWADIGELTPVSDSYKYSFPAEDLVFIQDNLDPTDVAVRPHKNTALGRWFQKQSQTLNSSNGTGLGDEMTPSKFAEIFKKHRSDELIQRKRLEEMYPDEMLDDLPF